MESDEAKNEFMSRLRERASNATQNLNSKLVTGIEKLKEQFKAKLNFLTVVIFIIILIILLFFIILGIYMPTQDIYFSIIQYITVIILFLMMLTFYMVNRPIVLKDQPKNE